MPPQRAFSMLALGLLLNVATVSASPYWSQLDTACRDADKIAAIDGAALATTDDRDAVVQYCRFTISPRFAARGDAERRARLAAVLAAAGVPVTQSAPSLPGPALTSVILNAAEDQLRRDPPPELGLIGEKILGTALGGLCKNDEARAVLRMTCALPSSTSLRAARLAVLRDLIAAVVERIQENGPRSLRLLASALTTEDLRAIDLSVLLGGKPCATPQTSDTCDAPSRAVALARALTERLLGDGPRLDRDKRHYRYVAEEVIREQLAPSGSAFVLGPSATAATDSLVDAFRALDEERQLTAHVSGTVLAAKMLIAIRRIVVLGAAALAEADPAVAAASDQLAIALGPSTETTLAILDCVAHADAKGALDASARALDEGGKQGTLSPASVRALRVAADLSAARTESDLKRTARDAFLPVPAWVDRFAFDLNVAPPVNKHGGGGSELSLNGDMTLGYNGERFGVVGSASSSYFEVEAAQNSALTERYAGSLDAWVLINVGRSAQLEPRLSLGATYYGTLASDTAGGANRQTNQDSIFGRGVGSIGVRVQPSSRVALAASVGVGGQYEDYFRVLQTSAGDQGTTFNVATTVRYEARARAQIVLWPQVLAFRARGDLQAFDMRRSDQAVTFSVGRATQSEQGVTEISQIELFARGFMDAEIARFFGFVPSVHGGVNVFSLALNGVGTTVVVPVVGIGIRREAL